MWGNIGGTWGNVEDNCGVKVCGANVGVVWGVRGIVGDCGGGGMMCGEKG